MLDQFQETEAGDPGLNQPEQSGSEGVKYVYFLHIPGETRARVLPETPSVFDVVLQVDGNDRVIRRATGIGGKRYSFDLQSLEINSGDSGQIQGAVIRETLFLDTDLTTERAIDYPKDLPRTSRFCGVVQVSEYNASGKLTDCRLVIFPRKKDLDEFRLEQKTESARQREGLKTGEEQILYWPQIIEDLKNFRAQTEERIKSGEIQLKQSPAGINLLLLIDAAREEQANPFLDLEKFSEN